MTNLQKNIGEDLEGKMHKLEKELTDAGVFEEEKKRTLAELEQERGLLIKFLQLQTQYIRSLYHKLNLKYKIFEKSAGD